MLCRCGSLHKVSSLQRKTLLWEIYYSRTKRRQEGIVIMGGLPTQSTASVISLSLPQKDQSSGNVASGTDSKPKKKICCACPETKKLRDECIVEHGEAACEKWIEAHRQCLRAEGFNV